ncbi:MAG: TenA family protein [Leptolyngbya sp. DLM2.Bin15]|nr:MAG: TenA family protein [Leptolyngbya sp. DLM2.Bin15]
MSVAQDLWQANQDLAIACFNNAFVQGIYSGTLPRHKFAYYVGQDAFFLESFARAYSIAAAKAPTWEGFGTFHDLAGGVLSELRLHQSYAQSWQVDLTQISPGAATRRYTDFLLATAWSQDTSVTTAAMLPCMKLYAYLGQQLARPAIPEHDYTDWIKTYSSPEFDDLAQQLAVLAEQAPRTAAVDAAYRYAMECERDFFQAAWDIEAET